MIVTRQSAMVALASLVLVALGAVAVTGAGPSDPGQAPVETGGHVSDHWGMDGDRDSHHHGDNWTDHPVSGPATTDHHDPASHHRSATPRHGEYGPTGYHGCDRTDHHGYDQTDHHGYDQTDRRESAPPHHGDDTPIPRGPATPHHHEGNLTTPHGPATSHHGPHH